MSHVFTSIHRTSERLQECEYFLGRLATATFSNFTFELNAFLSASRSVTFVLQKELSHVPAFAKWYETRVQEMKADAAMRFFIDLRNISQKCGPVAYVAGSGLNHRFSARFLSAGQEVPIQLVGRDIATCCAEHLRKLATLVFACNIALPFDTCMYKAFTPEGMKALGYTLRDAEETMGLPAGWLDVGGDEFSLTDRLGLLRREIDPIDDDELQRLAAGQFVFGEIAIELSVGCASDFLDDFAMEVGSHPDSLKNPRSTFISVLMKRIREVDQQ